MAAQAATVAAVAPPPQAFEHDDAIHFRQPQIEHHQVKRLGGEQHVGADAVAGDAQKLDVGGGADEAILEVAAHAVGDRQRDDQRGYAGSNAEDGDRGDQAHDGLAPAGAKVAGGDEEFEAQRVRWLS